MTVTGIVFLVIALTCFVISLVNTALIALVDCGKLDEDSAVIFMGGPVLWLINLVGIIVNKIRGR
jgi:hypothetical protein